MVFAIECIGINTQQKISKKTGNPYFIHTLKHKDEMFDVYSAHNLGLEFGQAKKVKFELDLKYKSLQAVGIDG